MGEGGDFHKVVAAILNLKLSLSSQKEHISLTETKGLAQYCTLHFCGNTDSRHYMLDISGLLLRRV